MSLRDYVVPTRVIAIDADNKVALRALGFADMQHFLVNRSGLIDTALKLFEGGFDVDQADDKEVQAFAVTLISQMPGLVAELIALAADEPDMGPTVQKLPGPVQLEALIAVYELTFSEPGGVGKFFGRLADLTASIPRPTRAPAQKNHPSAGSNSFGETLVS